ncbi:hypothetical protein [Microcystis aeruginosa]|jgi:hypothetical protein|uniref:Addiction module component n=1 Tax=Microcystis aeruginosa SPC777 TaxID=482300 RepID=S3JAX1_MICAE|nr:hypothetical protein [Microcystis aeruginosa]NCR98615.1 hypothetical protein [Microcystis aeruginosa L311-01]OCY15546.1 MAG: hypothetical protein BEV12_14660 [Microcystis aeruginosa CACIAM 03]TRU15147.1 MAG: hypothetical protein EWV59_04015 [Microcystis aeruginosa Ma_MB_F_20061100_S19D]TRU17254.1 MAG: hypothetical protein EWV58_05305 [Microcystis aeruginosa Ma_MB_F_20061100_S19]EPF17297.1 hypothetical protein MAESPC_04874 [Microcystis aeruginosa SPC777]
MNIQLVESLVNAIKSLSLEEQELLGKKLKDHPSWEIALERIDATRKAIYERRQGNPFETDVTEIIHQMREERNRQLIEVRCRKHCVAVRRSGRGRVCGY